jgi:SAM-dependent methyltransferase
MYLKALLRHAYKCLVEPNAHFSYQPGLLRSLVYRRRIFDVASMLLQARHLSKVSAVDDTSSTDNSDVAAARKWNAHVTKKKLITTTRRAEVLYHIAQVHDADPRRERLLIVGPRNVQEFLIAWMFGFSWKNISAIDLFSTHPKIEVMDMHAISLPPESVHVVTMAHTLSYSHDIPKVVAGIARILVPGGRFCFSHANVPGFAAFAGSRVTGDEIVEACSAVGLSVYHHEWKIKTNSDGNRQIGHYFGMRKVNANPMNEFQKEATALVARD